MAASPVVLRSRVLARAVSSTLRRNLLGAHPHPPCSPLAASTRPSAVHRLSSVCGGLLSVMPLHSAIASARLRSAISPESQSWGVVPQGAALAGFSFYVFLGTLQYCDCTGIGTRPWLC
ncbi:hypothetical protein PVAP13_4NG140800 [Panicum virgatum]|uniref:Uncharacterized protein n=1 Tax=Panicum virgatum TaxID=38727 RepID=A0A8T0T7M6_PANVG|nr:hypothetical protein PVAP13_4NG140800 [Panicum virgatum]